jgi:hypothetical protein
VSTKTLRNERGLRPQHVRLLGALLGQRSVTLFVDLKAVSGARFPIDEQAERRGRVSRTQSHAEMDVAGVKTRLVEAR